MKYRTLGRTNLRVSDIGFGAWGIGGSMWIGAQDEESVRALERAIGGGLNFIDTALAYGDGHSEQVVGGVVKRHPELIVATKVPPKNLVWPARPGVPIDKVFPYDYIVARTEQSLKNLDMETVHLQQLHVWSPEWIGADDWRRAAEKLKREGKIRFFGISVNDHQPESVMEVLRSGLIDVIQVIYNIFDQSPEDALLGLCEELNIGVIARVPFDEGSLTGNIRPDTTFPPGDWRHGYFAGDRKRQVWERIEKLRPLVAPHAAGLPDAALRFCLSHPAVSTVIPGIRTAKHAEENCASSDRGPLPPQLLQELRKHRWVRNFYG
jgi:aryl-alcohol dehydrogenase-like predicted oxidoreductase